MRGVSLGKIVATAATAVAVALPCGAAAAPPPAPYGADDAGGFLNILPPGQGESVNAAQIAAFLASGTRPAHTPISCRCTRTSSMPPRG